MTCLSTSNKVLQVHDIHFLPAWRVKNSVPCITHIVPCILSPVHRHLTILSLNCLKSLNPVFRVHCTMLFLFYWRTWSHIFEMHYWSLVHLFNSNSDFMVPTHTKFFFSNASLFMWFINYDVSPSHVCCHFQISYQLELSTLQNIS